MVIARGRPGHAVRQMRVVAHVEEIVGALRVRIIIAVIAALRRRRIAERVQVGRPVGRQVRIEERLGIRRIELDRSRDAAGGRLEEGGRVLVRLGHVVIVEIERQLAGLVVMDELGIGLIAALGAVEIPGTGVLARRRDIGRIAAAGAEPTAVDADEGARRIEAADRLAELDAKLVERRRRIGFDRAAEIAVRRGGEIAGAGRHDDPADILRNDRALRRQAIVIAVALVAQRHAVHRVAELVAGKAVDEDLRVLLVIAPGIGGDVKHAGQGLDRLERRDAGQDLLHLRPVELGRRAGRAAGDDDRRRGVELGIAGLRRAGGLSIAGLRRAGIRDGGLRGRRIGAEQCAGEREQAGSGTDHGGPFVVDVAAVQNEAPVPPHDAIFASFRLRSRDSGCAMTRRAPTGRRC